MAILTGLWFVDILRLEDQGKWLLSSGSNLGERSGLGIGCEGKIIVAAIVFVGCTSFGMAPDAIFQNIIPDVASASFCNG
jgi:hypothetical protein